MLYKSTHIPELDGLRGIAVLMVLIDHVTIDFLPKSLFKLLKMSGDLGVNIFFVLSGFLITRLIFADRIKGIPKSNFYLRRAARLVPAYILFLSFVGIIWGIGSELPWSITYTFNYARYFGLFLDKARPLFHTWSLCVEEHFYLIWPCIIWTFGKHSKYFCIAAICSSIIFAFALDIESTSGYLHYIRVYQPTHTRLVAISIGCLIAFYESKIINRPNILMVTAVGSALMALLSLTGSSKAPLAAKLINENFIAAVIFSICYRASLESSHLLSSFMKSKQICLTGKISYGIYLYHFPIYWLLGVNGPQCEQSAVTPWIAIVIVFTVSYLSFRFYEEPIRKLAHNTVISKKNSEPTANIAIDGK